MTLIDSLDSILMLYSYSGFPQRDWKLVEKRAPKPTPQSTPEVPRPSTSVVNYETFRANPQTKKNSNQEAVGTVDENSEAARRLLVKNNMMSGLSIVLTLISILVAFRSINPAHKALFYLTARFSISLITIMGLIGENCRKCREAAEDEDGGGLAGRWWRGWANASYSPFFLLSSF
jgi:high-affinity nickel-transport protein